MDVGNCRVDDRGDVENDGDWPDHARAYIGAAAVTVVALFISTQRLARPRLTKTGS